MRYLTTLQTVRGCLSQAMILSLASRSPRLRFPSFDVTVPTVVFKASTTAALPGIDFDTAHIEDDPIIDWAVLQPLVDKHRLRWELKATILAKEMEAASRWDCS